MGGSIVLSPEGSLDLGTANLALSVLVHLAADGTKPLIKTTMLVSLRSKCQAVLS